ncbi:MAG: glycoside hydrolase [Flavobacteriales bacterium]|nr:glycoside hydrolase [Flavobacteriales bacterium]
MLKIAVLSLLGILGAHVSHGQQEKLKINGVNLVSINGLIDSTHVQPLKTLGANWAATIPFAFMPSPTSPDLSFDLEWQWKGERVDGVRNYIQELHTKGISVMIKPQIWIGHGTYTGEIAMSSEADWLKLEENYREYLLTFTRLAVEEKVEMICIGTELGQFVENRPIYFRKLIKEIRSIYRGKLTYAANWDDFEAVTFWDDLDYIGVDAYFPISNKNKPSFHKLVDGWAPHKKKMDTLSKKFDRPILFTEYGYRSVAGCAAKPWDYSDSDKQDEKTQQYALKALYHVFWNEDNYVGGFLWKWYPDHSNAGGADNKMFTVQNKRAERLVRVVYGNSSNE